MNRPTGLDCFIYLRKSRKDIEVEKNEGSDTLERHRKQLLELAKKEQHNIVEIFEEVVSGEYIVDRPEIQRMLREVEQGSTQAVIVMDLDRLGRGDMFDMGLIFRAFQNSNTLVITPNEVIDTSNDGAELIFGVKSILSREELKAINKRMQRGRRQSAKEGKSISKHPPFGYLRDEKLKLYPNPETEWVVKYIFERIAEGAGRIQVARELDKMGVKPPGGGEFFRPATVTSIVRNEVYLGHIIWGQIEYIKKGGGKYQRKKVPPERWIRHNNAHEPLVTEELFNQANLAHSSRWRPPLVEKKTLSNPLAGILCCSICGRTMVMVPRTTKEKASGSKRKDHIRCMQTSCKGVQKGATLSIVEEKVISGLEQIISSFEANERNIKRKKRTNTLSQKKKHLKRKEKEMNELSLQKNNLHDFLEKGVYTIEVFMERQKVISSKIKAVEEQINLLKKEILEEEGKEKNKNIFVPKVKKVLEEYRSTDDIEKKNRLLKSVLEKATYLRKRDWRELDHFEIELYPRL